MIVFNTFLDPTSPFSGGAILGDRIRMRELSGDSGVFIRSMATRGNLGGLAWSQVVQAEVCWIAMQLEQELM